MRDVIDGRADDTLDIRYVSLCDKRMRLKQSNKRTEPVPHCAKGGLNKKANDVANTEDKPRRQQTSWPR